MVLMLFPSYRPEVSCAPDPLDLLARIVRGCYGAFPGGGRETGSSRAAVMPKHIAESFGVIGIYAHHPSYDVQRPHQARHVL